MPTKSTASESQSPPYTESEAEEARLWVGRHGPSNAWTASFGTAARMIGRLLKERERLIVELARCMEARRGTAENAADSKL